MNQPARSFLFFLLSFSIALSACSPAPPLANPTAVSTLHPSPIPATPTFTSFPTPTVTTSSTPTLAPTAPPTYTPTSTVSPRQQAADTARQLSRGQLTAARWSPDGKFILVNNSQGLDLLDVPSLEKLQDFAETSFITFVSDGRAFVKRGKELGFLDLSSGEYKAIKPPADLKLGWQGNYAISPDGVQLVYASGGNALTFINLDSGDSLTIQLEHEKFAIEGFSQLTFSPDSKYLFASASSFDGVNYLIDLSTMKPAYEMYVVDFPLFSPNGQHMLLYMNKALNLVLTRNGIPQTRFSAGFAVRPKTGGFTWYDAEAWDIHPGGKHVGVIYSDKNEGSLYLWNIETGQPETILKDLPRGNEALAFSPDGNQFLTVSSDGLVQIWNMDQGALIQSSQAYDQSYPVTNLETMTMAVARGGKVEVWDLANGEQVSSLGDFPVGTNLTIEGITDRHVLVSAYSNQDYRLKVILFDLESGEVVRTFMPYNSGCTMDREATRLVCGSQQLQVFDIATGKLLHSHKASEGVRQLWALSPDGRRLAVCSVTDEGGPGDRIFLLDLTGKQAVQTGTLEGGPPGVCGSMVFSPDSTWLAARNGATWRLDQPDQALLFPVSKLRALSFSPDSSLLLAGNQLMDLSNRQALMSLDYPEGTLSAFFDTSGELLRILTDTGIEVWQAQNK